MKVLSILSATPNPLGMIFTHRQIRSLEKCGVENLSFYIPAKGLSIGKLFRLVFQLRKVLKHFSPDLVHAQYGMLYAFVAAFSNLRPLVITFHGSELNTVRGEGIFRSLYKKSLSNLAILRATEVICVSPGLKKNIWWRRNIVNILPLGINIDEFRPIDRAEARKKLGWGSKGIVVLFNANNPVIKRLDIAEKTLEIVRRSIPDARLEVLEGKQDNRELIPFLLNASDCLLICSDSEGSPTMVKEAMACDVPVVGVDVGDVKVRLNGVDQSLVVKKDPALLADAIIRIVRADKPSSGREKLINDGLTEERVAGKIYAVYEKAQKKATSR